jgi:hypothetical protein
MSKVGEEIQGTTGALNYPKYHAITRQQYVALARVVVKEHWRIG